MSPKQWHEMIRTAERSDLEHIVTIYNEAVASRCTVDVSAVTVADRVVWFEEHNPQQHPIIVYLNQGKVVGWCSLSPYRKGRMALRYTAEISYYVAAEHHRNGIGSALLQEAIRVARSIGLKTLFAIVLETNVPSQKLLETMGFTRWGFLPDVADFGDYECGHYYFGLKLNQS